MITVGFAPGGAGSLHVTGRNARAMRDRASRDNVGTGKPGEPAPEAHLQSTVYQSLDQVVQGLGLPLDAQRKLRKGLAEAEGADDVLRAMVGGPLRALRADTGDAELVKEVGRRFVAYLGNGLVKARAPQSAPSSGVKTRGLPPGTIRKWRHGTFQKQADGSWTPVSEGGQGQQKQPSGKPGGTRAADGATGKAPAPSGGATPEGHEPKLEDYLGGYDPETFNALPKHERARLAADFDEVEGALGAYDPSEPYDANDMTSVVRSAAKHVRQLTQAGIFGAQSAVRMMDLVRLQQELATEAGLGAQTLATLLEGNVRKLAHQEEASTERTLGDHGVRHVAVNIANCMQILDSLKAGGKAVGPKERMMAAQVMIEHDMGYTIPAIHEGGFKIRDNFHPAASRVLWEQQPEMAEVFGRRAWADMAGMIETHSTSEVDWEGDMLGSAIRLADNTHLFADKFPEVLYDSRKGVELLAKLAILKRAATSDDNYAVGVKRLQTALIDHIDGRSDLSMSERARLTRAAREIGPMAVKFLGLRLAGRNAQYTYDAQAGRMNVVIEHSDARAAVGEVFGPDQADKQFAKLLEDYGWQKHELDAMEPPPPALEVGVPPGTEKEVINFRWTPGTKSDKREQAMADAMTSTAADWARIQKMAVGPRRQSAEDIFFGSLTKSLWAL